MNAYTLLPALAVLLAVIFVLMTHLRRQALEGFVTVPYRRARMLHRLERTLAKENGISLAEHMGKGKAENAARKKIAIEKDVRLLALYRERCVKGDTEIELPDPEQSNFNDEARRIDAFYPDRPSAI
ncbi:hypothetical protein [uncultured Sphingomonas sp.]|uniref:hypothetical protein n=1 Tax=uncultured Sphingomonas sp. TaxID=158754 RepID=UPI0035CC6F36